MEQGGPAVSRADRRCVHRRRECTLELHVVGNTGINQDTIVEVARQKKRIALWGPALHGSCRSSDQSAYIAPGQIASVDIFVDTTVIAGIGLPCTYVQTCAWPGWLAGWISESRVAGAMIPHAGIRNAAGIERTPDLRSAGRLEQPVSSTGLCCARRSEWIVGARSFNFDVGPVLRVIRSSSPSIHRTGLQVWSGQDFALDGNRSARIETGERPRTTSSSPHRRRYLFMTSGAGSTTA